MQSNSRFLIALIAAAGISGVACAQNMPGAQGAPCPMMQQGMQGGPMARQAGMRFDPAQRAERHLQALQAAIKPTPAQEPLWQAFAEKMKAQAGSGMQGMHAQMAATTMTAPERMAKMEEFMTARLAAMKDAHESFNRLYAALTPEQKAAADKFSARPFARGKAGGGRRGARGAGGGMPPQAPQG